MLPEKEDYAAFRQTIMAFMIATPFMTMGLGQGLYYFLPTEKERTRGRVLDAILIVLTMGTVFGTFLYFGGNELLAQRFSNPQVAALLLLLIPLCFAHAIMQLIAPILTILERIYSLTIFNIVSRVMIGILTICPVLIWVNPSAPLIGMTIGTGIACLAGLGLVFWYLPKDKLAPQADTINEILKFSIPLGVGGMIGALNLQLDKLIVSTMCTPEEFAVFSNGAIEIPLIGVLTGSIVAVLMVEMRKAVAENRHEEALELFRKTAIQTSYVLFPAAIFLFVFADSFISVLFSAEYSDAAYPFRIYLFLIPIRTVSFGALMIALGLNKVILFRGVITLIVNCILSLILVRIMGGIGAVVSTVATIFIWTVPCNLFFLSKSLSHPWWDLMPINRLFLIAARLTLYAITLVVLSWVTIDLPQFFRLSIGCAVAATWLMIWWNGKLYTLFDVKRLIAVRS